jgi:hypothetical protein
MLNTYIKNQGITKTIIHSNNHNHVNQTKWDADYDGDIANISINSNTDGHHKHLNISLDNEDLANLLNIQSVDMPIDKRLKMDFREPYYEPENYYIELPTPKLEPARPEIRAIEELNEPHISSPVTGEELVIPLTIDRKTADKFTLTPKKRHRRLKTHVTHKVYKKPRTSSLRKKSKRNRSSSSSKRKNSSIISLL